MSCDPYCLVFIALMLPLSLVEYYLCNLLLVSCVSVHTKSSLFLVKSVSSQVFVCLDFGFHFVK